MLMRVIAGLILVFSTPTELPFVPYEQAKRWHELVRTSSIPRGCDGPPGRDKRKGI